MCAAFVAHGLAAAHADRVRELAHLWALLEQAVAARGADGDAARDAHHVLSARAREWAIADEEAERRDVVTLAAADQDEMLREIDHAIPHAEVAARELPPTHDVHDVIRGLRRMRTALLNALPRAALVRFRRSAARLRRLVALGAPSVIIANEPDILLRALERALAPIDPRRIPFHSDDGFADTLFSAVHLCVVCEPGASDGVNLGLATSPAVATLLDVAEDDHADLNQQWVDRAAPSHPFARYPLVPRGRFCRVSPERLVRADFEETGPMGWAAGDDVAALARDLLALAGDRPAFAPELRTVSHRLETVSRSGHAVIGLIEYLSPEADGEMRWFRSEADDG